MLARIADGGRLRQACSRRPWRPRSSRAAIRISADAKQRFTPGLVATANHARSAAAADRLGAPIVRVEFDIGARPAAIRDDLAAIRRSGARPLLLAGFHGRMPTAAEARNLGAWAAASGRGRAAGSR